MFQLGLYSAHSWGVYMPLQAILGLSLHLVRSHGKQFDAKTMQKHIWWWTRSCDIVWTLAMAQVHPLILSGLVYNVTLFAIWSCLQHHLRLQNSTKWLTQVQIMFDFDHVSCFMFLGINKICKIPRSKFLVNIATFCFEKCPLNIKTEFYSIC